jgi:hypothetical protein
MMPLAKTQFVKYVGQLVQLPDGDVAVGASDVEQGIVDSAIDACFDDRPKGVSAFGHVELTMRVEPYKIPDFYDVQIARH